MIFTYETVIKDRLKTYKSHLLYYNWLADQTRREINQSAHRSYLSNTWPVHCRNEPILIVIQSFGSRTILPNHRLQKVKHRTGNDLVKYKTDTYF